MDPDPDPGGPKTCGSGGSGSGFGSGTLELTRGPPEVSSALSFIGGVQINARALLYINLIWFGNIARLSQWGQEEDNFLVQMVLPAVAMCRGRGGGGWHPVVGLRGPISVLWIRIRLHLLLRFGTVPTLFLTFLTHIFEILCGLKMRSTTLTSTPLCYIFCVKSGLLYYIFLMIDMGRI